MPGGDLELVGRIPRRRDPNDQLQHMAGAMSEMKQRHAYSIRACLECHLLRPRGCAGTHGFLWHIDCISSGAAIVAQRPCEPWGVTSNLKYERVVTLVSLP